MIRRSFLKLFATLFGVSSVAGGAVESVWGYITVTLSSGEEREQCSHCRQTIVGITTDRANHYLDHGYKLIRVFTHNAGGRFYTMITLRGKVTLDAKGSFITDEELARHTA